MSQSAETGGKIGVAVMELAQIPPKFLKIHFEKNYTTDYNQYITQTADVLSPQLVNVLLS
ncbi:MAG: hypothetical protein DDG60_09940 [Anaerolineae bacterium]|nr:MAG: hypothetical protein DDG60_09940 [Anaerolineae bacterium]